MYYNNIKNFHFNVRKKGALSYGEGSLLCTCYLGLAT
jgi:hypothetical protein